MNKETNTTPFEAIRQQDEAGNEYWSARDLYQILGYTNWRNFKTAIEKARVACVNSGQIPEDHFDSTIKMVSIGSGSFRKVEDFNLSQYACYLVIQNADPTKEIVAQGQTYFAVQTRRQEEADELAGLTEAQRRIFLRSQLTDHNKQLADTAKGAGVVSTFDFAIFQDHGYSGLYAGKKSQRYCQAQGVKAQRKNT